MRLEYFKYLMPLLLFMLWSLQVQAELPGNLGIQMSNGNVLYKDSNYTIEGLEKNVNGTNLIQEFTCFNLYKNESVTFDTSQVSSVENIINKIYNAKPSWLNGTIVSDKNLYFINPSGIIFGDNVSLNVNGLFVATTADYIYSSQTTQMKSEMLDSQLHITATPTTFGFIDESPGKIKFENADLCSPTNDMLIIGGDITFDNTQVNIQGRSLKIASVASAGEVLISDKGIDTSSCENLGKVNFSADDQSKKIEARNIDITSDVFTSNMMNFTVIPNDNSQVSSINIKSDLVELDNHSCIHAETISEGIHAGNIHLSGKEFYLQGGSEILTYSLEGGNAGDVKIHTSDIILLSGYKTSILTGGISENLKSGNIELISKNVVLRNGAGFSSLVNGMSEGGQGGNIIIKALETIQFSGKENGISCSIHSKSFGDNPNETAGNIYLNAKNILLFDGAEINAESENAGGGEIIIHAQKDFIMNDSTITSTVENGTRNGGNITIHSDISLLMNHSKIQAMASQGNGGNIRFITNGYIQSTDSILDASSSAGIDGDIFIDSPEKNISNDLLLQSPDTLPTDQWLSNACDKRNAENISHFYLSYRDGMLAPFDDIRPAPLFLLELLNTNIISESDSFIQKMKSLESKGKINQIFTTLSSELNNYSKIPSNAYVLHIYLAILYQQAGFYAKSKQIYDDILPSIKAMNDPNMYALFLSFLSDWYLSKGNTKQASALIRKAEKFHPDNLYIRSIHLHHSGNIYLFKKYYHRAIHSYQKSLETIDQSSLKKENANTMKSSLMINLMYSKCMDFYENETGNEFYLKQTAEKIWSHLKELPSTYENISNMLTFGLFCARIQKHLYDNSNQRDCKMLYSCLDDLAQKSLKTVRHLSMNNGHLLLTSWASGNLGEIASTHQNNKEAFERTREAIYYTPDNSPEILFRWHWQLAKLYQNIQSTQKAVDSYYNAILAIQPDFLKKGYPFFSGIIKSFNNGYRFKKNLFLNWVKPLFLELTEILIEQETYAKNDDTKKDLMSHAINILENLKISEYINYYNDDCISHMSSKSFQLSGIDRHTAILYPVLTHNYMALLVVRNDTTFLVKRNFENTLAKQRFIQKLKSFVLQTSSFSPTSNVKQLSYDLYDEIIHPIDNLLTQMDIDTLVIVPQGIFRTLPFSALKDRQTEQYVIQKYALSFSPVLSLTRMSSRKKHDTTVLLNGLSESRHGFKSLPHVETELESIHSIADARVLFNNNFTTSNFSDLFTRNRFDIVHCASHGVFGKTPEKTYLLAYDEAITINSLKKMLFNNSIQNNDLDLLVLSACHTAIGDEQSVMGLAGISLKTGVCSAVGSLWAVDDESTSILMQHFYDKLINHQYPKSKALQSAQLSLIETMGNKKFNQPQYWAPFVLIGNWM